MKKFFANRKAITDFLFIIFGSFVQAIAMRLFLIPGLMVSGGKSGAAQIIQFYTNWPIGVMVFLGNMPLFLLGWRYLGGTRFAMRTAVAITLFSIFTDGLTFFLPVEGITNDIFLLALYGG
ncbi:MAG: YitT family protein, partial [Anaerolineales bacterium]